MLRKFCIKPKHLCNFTYFPNGDYLGDFPDNVRINDILQ